MRALPLLLLLACAPELADRDEWPATPLPNCEGDIDVTEIFARSCGPGCHDGEDPAAGLDLLAANPFQHLISATSQSCDGEILVDPTDVSNSFLMDKLKGPSHIPPGCGDPMPFGARLTGNEIGCIERWLWDNVMLGGDAGLPDAFVGMDSGTDADTLVDAGLDAAGRADAAIDGGLDGGVDASPDGGFDGGSDAGVLTALSLEAEDASRQAPWELTASGVAAGSFNGEATAPPNGSTVGLLEFDVASFPPGATVYVWIRFSAPGQGANSVFVSTGGPYAQVGVAETARGAFEWAQLAQNGTGADFTLSLKNREAQFEVDRVVFSTDPGMDPDSI